MPIKQIAVLGAGTMGHGIAHAAIAGGYDTRMFDVSAAALEKGAASIERIIGKGVELGKELATGLLPVVKGKESAEAHDSSTAGLVTAIQRLRGDA